jgi:hypothetical protein
MNLEPTDNFILSLVENEHEAIIHAQQLGLLPVSKICCQKCCLLNK